jgi:hypothetical protein
MNMFLQSLIIGIIATLAMDIWALILNKGFSVHTTNWGMVGRWFGHIPHGVFIHRPIAESEPIAYENLIGWGAHYAIGIFYGFLYLYIVVVLMSSTPTFLSALIFALATLIAPWFILQPGLGFGVFARKAPNPYALRLLTISMHTIFGCGLYLGCLLLSI